MQSSLGGLKDQSRRNFPMRCLQLESPGSNKLSPATCAESRHATTELSGADAQTRIALPYRMATALECSHAYNDKA